jgi:hypothetical protein
VFFVKSDFFSSVYDVLGYMIPGVVVLWTGRVLAREILGLDLVADIPTSALGVTVLLLAAPPVGFLFQALGRRVESDLINPRVTDANGKKRRMFPSARYRMENDTHFSTEFKKCFEESAAATFGLSENTREAFDLAYHYLLVNDQAALPERFNALYGMARGLTMALTLAGIVYGLEFLQEIDATEKARAWEALFVAAVLFAGAVLAFMQARSFGRRFADSVFRGFLASVTTGKSL